MKTILSKDHYDAIIAKVAAMLKEQEVAIVFCSDVNGPISVPLFYDAFIDAAKHYKCPFSFTREVSQGYTNIVLSIAFKRPEE